MGWDEISALAAIAGAFVVLVGAVVAIVQLKHLRLTYQIGTYVELLGLRSESAFSSSAPSRLGALRRRSRLRRSLPFIIFATLLLWPVAVEAQSLNVLISGGFSGAYEQLLPEFEQMSGIKVTTKSAASQGTGPQTIAAQLAGGVHADVVILSREGLDQLIAAKRIVAGTDVDLARVGLGVLVRTGTPKPDVSTIEGFKQAMLHAKISHLRPRF